MPTSLWLAGIAAKSRPRPMSTSYRLSNWCNMMQHKTSLQSKCHLHCCIGSVMVSCSASVSQFQPTKVPTNVNWLTKSPVSGSKTWSTASWRRGDQVFKHFKGRLKHVKTCWNFLVCLTWFSHVILCPGFPNISQLQVTGWGEEEFMVRQLERRWCSSLTICDPGSLNGENWRNWRNWDPEISLGNP